MRKVEQKQMTTYNEVADELVAELKSGGDLNVGKIRSDQVLLSPLLPLIYLFNSYYYLFIFIIFIIYLSYYLFNYFLFISFEFFIVFFYLLFYFKETRKD